MKDVKPNRFQKLKPEEISFKGAPMPENSPISSQNQGEERTDVRTNERTKQPTNVRPKGGKAPRQPLSGDSYTIEIPIERKKTRHSFDIFEDQKTALNKIQMAAVDAGDKKKPVLGEMIQEAIDDYIAHKARQSPNLKVVREEQNERTNERSDVRPGNGE